MCIFGCTSFYADVVKLVNTLARGANVLWLGGSSPLIRTLKEKTMSEYEFGIPEELMPWIEHQREVEAKARSLDRLYYILVNGKIKHATMFEWAEWFGDGSKRRIDYTEFEDGSYVSTVFLGLDHNFRFDKFLEHRPILFETMMFGGKFDQLQWRYSTLGEAKQGHYEIVSAVREDRNPNMEWGEEGFWSNFRKMFDDKDE